MQVLCKKVFNSFKHTNYHYKVHNISVLKLGTIEVESANLSSYLIMITEKYDFLDLNLKMYILCKVIN